MCRCVKRQHMKEFTDWKTGQSGQETGRFAFVIDLVILGLTAASRVYFLMYFIDMVFRKGKLMPHDKLSGTLYTVICTAKKEELWKSWQYGSLPAYWCLSQREEAAAMNSSTSPLRMPCPIYCPVWKSSWVMTEKKNRNRNKAPEELGGRKLLFRISFPLFAVWQ